ncbi:hypothetical protein LOTGIDRAFT_159987 [Lottia gigantea]|uniref:THAP-type domain-containing protein n=1 Tax=Lottia gigantea TaxID=225164 RepID=V4AGJ7_LOTGI|nr:hypothetical protein LOTGIDRAFT_159987 [Lottia gigantea]ESO96007.1 hypothetical protein LOTGIDRAFT_159987 [Lottia gigantea]
MQIYHTKNVCIPKNEDRRRAWLKAINRKDFDPRGKELVCSIHFIDGRPTKLNHYPSIHLGYEREVKPGRRVPLSNVAQNYQEEDVDICTEEIDCSLEVLPSFNSITTSVQTDGIICHSPSDFCSRLVNTSEMSTQTEHSYSILKPTYKAVSTQHTTAEFSSSILKTDSDSKFYTGLTLTVLLSIISSLSSFGEKLSFSLPVFDQILFNSCSFKIGCSLQGYCSQI